MLVNVNKESVSLVATADNAYAVSNKIELGNNLSSSDSREDVFASDYTLLEGNRISILVDDAYVKTTIEQAKILSSTPFEYDTSLITNGAIPTKVFLTGETIIEVKDISILMEFPNVSISVDPDTLRLNRNILESETIILITGDNMAHEFDHVDVASEVIPRIRYIRDYVNGSTSNTGDHWVEIQAYERGTGTNRAASANGATITGSVAQNASYPYSRIIDGSTNTAVYSASSVSGLQYVQIDLGDEYDIESLKVWHYYNDGRTYYATKTQVSLDGVTWFDMYDSATDGTYQETSAGKSMPIVDGPTIAIGGTMDTSLITKGEVPLRAYVPGVGLSFGDITPEWDDREYLLESYEDFFNDVDVLPMLLTQKRFNIVSDTVDARIDFKSIGDRMMKLKFNASRMINNMKIGSSASIQSGSGKLTLSQTIHLPMRDAGSGVTTTEPVPPIGSDAYRDKVVLMDDGHYWGVGENTVEPYADGMDGTQDIITDEFNSYYELAEWNDYVQLGSIAPLENLGVGFTATSICAMTYGGAGWTSSYSYFKYDGSGANLSSHSFPSGTSYLGRWYGRRIPLVRHKNIGEM